MAVRQTLTTLSCWLEDLYVWDLDGGANLMLRMLRKLWCTTRLAPSDFAALLCLFVVSVSVSGVSISTARAVELTVHFRSGTVLTGDVADQSIAWTTVAANGAVSQFTYKTDQIKSLALSATESSAQTIGVRQLLNQLNDADYHKRESAQRQLKTTVGKYRSIVESFVDHSSFEVRYRVNQLLKEKNSQTAASTKHQWDRITLNDGRVWEGEATNFSLNLVAYGKTIKLQRSNVLGLRNGPTATPAQPSAVNEANATGEGAGAGPALAQVNLFHRFEDFNAPGQKEFRFDILPDGKPFALKMKLDDFFIDDGLLFRHAEKGFVGISSYPFKFDPLPVGGRSVCLYGERMGRNHKGVMEIRFCEPGNPLVAAGVYEFGTFIAKVGFRRDIILEAYGAQGQLLATVEGTDQKCVFAGVKSNQLITKVLILSNPYLKTIERKIDDDYAIDTLRMSTPIAANVHPQEQERMTQVVLKNGDVINWAALNFTRDQKLRLLVRKVVDQPMELLFPLTEIRSAYFGRPRQTSSAWQTLFEDGSRINVLPGKLFQSARFGVSFTPGDFVGCWPAASAPRLPVADDFNGGQSSPLVVFPTCRVRTKSAEFLSDRVSWVEDRKLQQPLQLGDRDTDEDPTPQQTMFKYSDTLANQLPTLWTRPPKVLPSDGSFIHLTDGHRLAFGKQGQFELKGIGIRTITVAHRDGPPKDIPLTDLLSIEFGDR